MQLSNVNVFYRYICEIHGLKTIYKENGFLTSVKRDAGGKHHIPIIHGKTGRTDITTFDKFKSYLQVLVLVYSTLVKFARMLSHLFTISISIRVKWGRP